MTMKTIETELHMEIAIPQTPNYLRQELPPHLKNCGLPERTIAIQEFSDDFLKRVGEAWTAALIADAQHKRENMKKLPSDPSKWP
jgi:hypothetical protein